MSVTFEGTYTKDNGAAPAAGTVAITPDGGSTTTETLDSTGSYSVAIAGTKFTVVETITGISGASTKVVQAIDAETVDTSRDVGRIDAADSESGPNPLKIGSIKIFVVTGVPGGSGAAATPGAADGDVAIRTDGANGTVDTFYQHQSGAWVALTP